MYQFPFSFFPSFNKPIDKRLSVRPFVRLMCKSLFKAHFPSIHINFQHRFGILVTQGAFLAIYGDNCMTHVEDRSISVFFFLLSNKPIDQSLSVRPFVRSMCKSLFKAPFPSIHIKFKHRFGILVTQGAF